MSHQQQEYLKSREWLQTLQSFIYSTLRPIISDVNPYVGKEAMLIWTEAFTHETYSLSSNYEDLEYLGDAILKALFPKYLMKRFPQFHKKEFTELNVAYMSKVSNAQMAKKMGLGKHIRMLGLSEASFNVEADAFESFFGALDTISDMIVPGLGFANCYNMVIHLYTNFEIDETRAEGAQKTLVQQIFSRFDLPVLTEISPGYQLNISFSAQLAHEVTNATEIISNTSNKKSDAEAEVNAEIVKRLVDADLIRISETNTKQKAGDNITFVLKLKPQQLQFLKTKGVNTSNIKQNILATGRGRTKISAEKEAYAHALAMLNSMGVNTKWAENIKHQQDLDDPHLKQLLPALNKKLSERGYKSFHFFIPRKTSNYKGSVVQLIGVKKDTGYLDVLQVIYTQESTKSYKDIKYKLAETYISEV